MLNDEYQSMAANAICHSASMVQGSWQEASHELTRPSVIFRPSLSVDGNQWCALYGEDLQNGVAGFGDSPALAMYAFDLEWHKKLATRTTRDET